MPCWTTASTKEAWPGSNNHENCLNAATSSKKSVSGSFFCSAAQWAATASRPQTSRSLGRWGFFLAHCQGSAENNAAVRKLLALPVWLRLLMEKRISAFAKTKATLQQKVHDAEMSGNHTALGKAPLIRIC